MRKVSLRLLLYIVEAGWKEIGEKTELMKERLAVL